MAGGNGIELSEADKHGIAEAVDRAEAETGLEIIVYVGNSRRDSRKQVAKLLARKGITERPGVIIGLLGRHSKIEIVTGPAAQERLSDEACADAIEAMAPHFKEGLWVQGLDAGLQVIAAACGQGEAAGSELPNLLE